MEIKQFDPRRNSLSKVIACIWCSHWAMIYSLEMDILEEDIGEMIKSH